MFDIKVLDSTLDSEFCRSFVTDAAAGGIVVFVGTVRNQTQGKKVLKLDFEAFDSMAVKEMTTIAEAISTKWNALHVAIHHRKGSLQISEIAVIIAVSTPHRAAAFEACQYAIDTLKETVPIWKKEFFEDGEVWVATHP